MIILRYLKLPVVMFVLVMAGNQDLVEPTRRSNTTIITCIVQLTCILLLSVHESLIVMIIITNTLSSY